MKILEVIKSLRIQQWIKNLFVFAPLVFSRNVFVLPLLVKTLLAFILFCILTGAAYILNDILDLEQDKLHPVKSKRPLASGKWEIDNAILASVFLMILGLAGAFFLDVYFFAVLFVYLILQIFYSLWLKHFVIIDVLIIAAGFVLRVAAGVSLISVERFSPWLYVCMTLLALYMGFGKRRAELTLLNTEANAHRRVLDGYTVTFLDQLITIVSGATIIAYSLYTFSAPNVPENHTMMLTIPFVVYAIFRYLYLVQVKQQGGAPEDIALTDRPLQATFILWGIAIVAIFYGIQ